MGTPDANFQLNTQDPTKVHFTTRYYAFAPVRVHPFQISVRRQPETFRPASPGIPTQYLAQKNAMVEIWVLTGPQQSLETAETAYFNMIQEIKRIIRTQVANFGNNILSVIIESVDPDEGALQRVPARIHVRMRVLATLFETS